MVGRRGRGGRIRHRCGCAAVSDATAAARVLVLEKAAAAGGTTSMAGGHSYLGVGTAVQQATGHEDTAEETCKYLVAMSREPEHDKIRAYCEGSVEHFEWPENLGFQFERSYYRAKSLCRRAASLSAEKSPISGNKPSNMSSIMADGSDTQPPKTQRL